MSFRLLRTRMSPPPKEEDIGMQSMSLARAGNIRFKELFLENHDAACGKSPRSNLAYVYGGEVLTHSHSNIIRRASENSTLLVKSVWYFRVYHVLPLTLNALRMTESNKHADKVLT
eukprot:4492503-Amphidinium_carterae.1